MKNKVNDMKELLKNTELFFQVSCILITNFCAYIKLWDQILSGSNHCFEPLDSFLPFLQIIFAYFSKFYMVILIKRFPLL